MMIYLCRDDFDSILCGVYDAWMSRRGHENVKLELEGTGNMELFAEYCEVRESEEKAEKVIAAVKKKISPEAYIWIYKAALSCEPEKADWIYRFLIDGFRIGRTVTGCFQLEAVHEIFRMNRSIGNEAHLLTEFIRFTELRDKVLFSEIEPKNDVLPLLAPHFSDRLGSERFIIYDVNRKKAVVHAPETGWYILSGTAGAELGKLAEQTGGEEYETLWKVFFESIGIRERKNYACQRSHLPLRFRLYMTEFQEKIKK